MQLHRLLLLHPVLEQAVKYFVFVFFFSIETYICFTLNLLFFCSYYDNISSNMDNHIYKFPFKVEITVSNWGYESYKLIWVSIYGAQEEFTWIQ